MDLGLQGKQAIVAGGSRGIGKAIALELAHEGVDVAIVSRSLKDLEDAAQELERETGRRIIPLATDVTKREQVERMVTQAIEQLGGLHILVNMVDASEIAYVTAFLASDKAWSITGELIVANGGAGRSVYY